MSETPESNGEYKKPTLSDTLSNDESAHLYRVAVKSEGEIDSGEGAERVADKPTNLGRRREGRRNRREKGSVSPFDGLEQDLQRHVLNDSPGNILGAGEFLKLDRATFDALILERAPTDEIRNKKVVQRIIEAFNVVDNVRTRSSSMNVHELEDVRTRLTRLLNESAREGQTYEGLRAVLTEVSKEVAEKIHNIEVQSATTPAVNPESHDNTQQQVTEQERGATSPLKESLASEAVPKNPNAPEDAPLVRFASGNFLLLSEDSFEQWVQALRGDSQEAKIARRVWNLNKALSVGDLSLEQRNDCDIILNELTDLESEYSATGLRRAIEQIRDIRTDTGGNSAVPYIPPQTPIVNENNAGEERVRDTNANEARERVRTTSLATGMNEASQPRGARTRTEDGKTVDRIAGIRTDEHQEGNKVTWSLWERKGYSELRTARDAYLEALEDYEKERAGSTFLGRFLALDLNESAKKRDVALQDYNELLDKVRDDFKKQINEYQSKKYATREGRTEDEVAESHAQRVEKLTRLHDLMLRQSMMRDVAAIEQAAHNAKGPESATWQWCKEKYQKYYGSLPIEKKFAVALGLGFLAGSSASVAVAIASGASAGVGILSAISAGATAAVRRGVGFGTGLAAGVATKEGLTAVHRFATKSAREKQDAGEKSLSALRDTQLKRHRFDKRVGMATTGVAGLAAWLAGGTTNGALAGALEGNVDSIGGHIKDNLTAKPFRTLFFGDDTQASTVSAPEQLAPPSQEVQKPEQAPPVPPAAPPTPQNIPPIVEAPQPPKGPPAGGGGGAAGVAAAGAPVTPIAEGPTQPGNFTARDVDAIQGHKDHHPTGRRTIEHTPEERERMRGTKAAGVAAVGHVPGNPHGSPFTTQPELQRSFERGLGTKLAIASASDVNPGKTPEWNTGKIQPERAVEDRYDTASRALGGRGIHTPVHSKGINTANAVHALEQAAHERLGDPNLAYDPRAAAQAAVQELDRSHANEVAPKSLTFSGTYAPGESVQRALQHFLAQDDWVKRQYPDLSVAERGRAAHLLQTELARNPKLARGFAEAFGVKKGNWNLVGKGGGYKVTLDTSMVERVLDRVHGQRGGVVLESPRGASVSEVVRGATVHTEVEQPVARQESGMPQAQQKHVVDTASQKVDAHHHHTTDTVETKHTNSPTVHAAPEAASASIRKLFSAADLRRNDFKNLFEDLATAQENNVADYAGKTSGVILHQWFGKGSMLFDQKWLHYCDNDRYLASFWPVISSTNVGSVTDARIGNAFAYSYGNFASGKHTIPLSATAERYLQSFLLEVEKIPEGRAVLHDPAFQNRTIGELVIEIDKRLKAPSVVTPAPGRAQSALGRNVEIAQSSSVVRPLPSSNARMLLEEAERGRLPDTPSGVFRERLPDTTSFHVGERPIVATDAFEVGNMKPQRAGITFGGWFGGGVRDLIDPPVAVRVAPVSLDTLSPESGVKADASFAKDLNTVNPKLTFDEAMKNEQYQDFIAKLTRDLVMQENRLHRTNYAQGRAWLDPTAFRDMNAYDAVRQLEEQYIRMSLERR